MSWILHLQRAYESGQRSESSLGLCLHGLSVGEPNKRSTQLGRDYRRERTLLGGLYPQRQHAACLCVFTDLVEQHGLADTSQSHHYYALARTANPDSLNSDSGGFPQVVTSYHLRRTCCLHLAQVWGYELDTMRKLYNGRDISDITRKE